MIKLKHILIEYISNTELDSIEKYVDRLFLAFNIDVEFTKHFKERMNDARNNKPIISTELITLFKKTFTKHAINISKLTHGQNRVIKDIETDINVPFVIEFNPKTKTMELIAKTIMRKPNFTTAKTSPFLKV